MEFSFSGENGQSSLLPLNEKGVPQLIVQHTGNDNSLLELKEKNAYQASYIAQLEERINKLEKSSGAHAKQPLRPEEGVAEDGCCAHCGQSLPQPEPQPLQPVPKQPVYGKRECPIRKENGLIDGRSNSQLAFEEKCELLKEFHKEFGHTRVGKVTPKKYAPLIKFIEKQRRYYRQHLSGTPKTPMEMDRFKKLQEIGVVLYTACPDYDGHFNKMLPLLKAFQKEHGHCCVVAVEGSKESELAQFAETCRLNLRRSRYLDQLQQGATVDRGEKEGESDTDSDDQLQPVDENNEGNGGKSTAKDTMSHPPPLWFTPKMRQQLEALEDHYLDHYLDVDDSVTSKIFARLKEQLKIINGASVIAWLKKLEEFRRFVKKSGHGFFPMKAKVGNDTMILFIQKERKIYNAIRTNLVESHPVLEKRIQLLESVGFIFDPEVLRRNQEEKEEEEMRKQTPQFRLQELNHRTLATQKELDEIAEVQKKAKGRSVAARAKYNALRLEAQAIEKEIYNGKKRVITPQAAGVGGSRQKTNAGTKKTVVMQGSAPPVNVTAGPRPPPFPPYQYVPHYPYPPPPPPPPLYMFPNQWGPNRAIAPRYVTTPMFYGAMNSANTGGVPIGCPKVPVPATKEEKNYGAINSANTCTRGVTNGGATAPAQAAKGKKNKKIDVSAVLRRPTLPGCIE